MTLTLGGEKKGEMGQRLDSTRPILEKGADTGQVILLRELNETVGVLARRKMGIG